MSGVSKVAWPIRLALIMGAPYGEPSDGRRQAAIDGDLLSGDVGTRLRCEEHREPCEVSRLAPPPQRHQAVDAGDEGLVAQQRPGEVGLEIARRDGVAG